VNLPSKEILPRSFRVTGQQDDRGPVLWPEYGLAAPCRLRSRGATGVNVYPPIREADNRYSYFVIDHISPA
jgi:hypothetical protein